jgi:hypothetical protein
MQSFSICTNLRCRFLFDFGENSEEDRSSLHLIRTCPKCGNLLWRQCPFCLRLLRVTWRQEEPHCLYCGRDLKAEAI